MLESSDLLMEEQRPANANPLWSYDFLERHNLFGHAYKKTQDKVYYPYWKSQLSRNMMLKLELQKLGHDLEKDGMKVYLLKGFSLMGEIYEDWGERFVSDVDLLISFDQMWRLTDLLKMHGYEKKREAKWLGNLHKQTFVKSTAELDFSIEVHTQLFWHQALNMDETAEGDKINGFYRLSPENQLIHLCGDLAFQHGYSQLFLLMDVYKTVDSYRTKINWDLFWEKAIRAGLYKSCYFTLFLCQKIGLNIQTIVYLAPRRKRIAIFLLKKIVNFSYLYNPNQHPVRYFITKFLIKDSLVDNGRYALAWLKMLKFRP